MARAMVINYGFSDIGPWSLLDPSAQSPDMIMRMMARNSVSESLQQRIDHAVKDIAESAYDKAVGIVSEGWAGWLGRFVVALGVGLVAMQWGLCRVHCVSCVRIFKCCQQQLVSRRGVSG